MNLPYRKSPRIPGYDYSGENYYFVTICTHEKRCIFGYAGRLNAFGEIAHKDLQAIPAHYADVAIQKFVVMPNHVHAIITISHGDGPAPDLNTVIGQYKAGVSRKIHMLEPDIPVWQRSYHDHVIRDQAGYEKIWQYIDTNPQRWAEDCFYAENQP